MAASAQAPDEPTSWEELRRQLAHQMLSRVAGAPLVPGNRIELLRDGAENFPAWREAIEAARRFVHFEMYIVHDDPVGRDFAELLGRKAREGVAVRVLYDWLGALGKTPRRYWRDLEKAGVEVRAFNPLRLTSPLGWVRRDHRKVVAVDGAVAFVSGLCVGQDWLGQPERGVAAWRDTGVRLRGPAVADVDRAFAECWALAGEPLPEAERPAEEPGPETGDQLVRVIAGSPDTAGLLRLDLLWAAAARERLWITDAYFVGTPSYLDALRSAARGGVDVRLLVPGASDIGFVAALTRTQYRSLLEAGVRVFEWKGPMLHAKSAVVDGRWARVGSTNLNLASWIGNWEIDVCVEDPGFAGELETSFARDLEDATEIVLEARGGPRRRAPPVRVVEARAPGREPGHGVEGARGHRTPATASRAAAAAVTLGGRVGAALSQRPLGTSEARPLAVIGAVLLVLAVVAMAWPRVLAVPAGLVAAWLGLGLLARAREVRRRERHGRRSAPPPPS
jgi:cardiolipin synthase